MEIKAVHDHDTKNFFKIPNLEEKASAMANDAETASTQVSENQAKLDIGESEIVSIAALYNYNQNYFCFCEQFCRVY